MCLPNFKQTEWTFMVPFKPQRLYPTPDGLNVHMSRFSAVELIEGEVIVIATRRYDYQEMDLFDRMMQIRLTGGYHKKKSNNEEAVF